VFWILPDDFVTGVVPLFNVALIGSLNYVTRRLRSRVRGCEADSQCLQAGVAYFSVQFLAICCLASIFIPNAFATDEAIRTAGEYIPPDWLQALDQFARPIPEVLLYSVVLGIWISGLPLLLS
jgi:hypothetical protein